MVWRSLVPTVFMDPRLNYIDRIAEITESLHGSTCTILVIEPGSQVKQHWAIPDLG